MTDSFNRAVDYMRVSITDRCNLRCKYCMPSDMPMVSHSEVLRIEEFTRMCEIASNCGVKNIKITGGEPLVRRGWLDLIKNVKALPKIEHVTLTTNGVLLGDYAQVLAKIGIDGINISLDTLDPEDYARMTGNASLESVLEALRKVVGLGIRTKINCVLLKGFNDGACAKLARLAEDLPVDVRFIELMPIGHGIDYSGVSGDDIIKVLAGTYPDLKETREKRGFGPARYYESAKLKGKIGVINAVSHNFCESCNRVRLTSEGFLKLCLYHETGVDFRSRLRSGATNAELEAAFREALAIKPERHMFESGIQAESRIMSRIGG